jgi:hypothetical protein
MTRKNNKILADIKKQIIDAITAIVLREYIECQKQNPRLKICINDSPSIQSHDSLFLAII